VSLRLLCIWRRNRGDEIFSSSSQRPLQGESFIGLLYPSPPGDR
jgi:hypothetical protein